MESLNVGSTSLLLHSTPQKRGTSGRLSSTNVKKASIAAPTLPDSKGATLPLVPCSTKSVELKHVLRENVPAIETSACSFVFQDGHIWKLRFPSIILRSMNVKFPVSKCHKMHDFEFQSPWNLYSGGPTMTEIQSYVIMLLVGRFVVYIVIVSLSVLSSS